jgi:hypothetical protein
MKTIEISDYGFVICDFCNDDYTNSGESGGMLYLNNAICPNCSKKIDEKISASGSGKSFIKARCPIYMSFSDWVKNVLR